MSEVIPIAHPEMQPPTTGNYYEADKESIEASRKASIAMAQEYEEQRWESLVAMMDSFTDLKSAERLQFYMVREPGLVNAPEPVWDAVLEGLKKFPQLNAQFPELAMQIAAIAPWLCGIAAAGKFPAKEARKYALDYKGLLREARK